MVAGPETRLLILSVMSVISAPVDRTVVGDHSPELGTERLHRRCEHIFLRLSGADDEKGSIDVWDHLRDIGHGNDWGKIENHPLVHGSELLHHRLYRLRVKQVSR